MAELAQEARAQVVLTNAVRYLDPADSPAAQVLDAARHLVPLGSPRLAPHNGQAYLASPAEMAAVAERVAAAMSQGSWASQGWASWGSWVSRIGRVSRGPGVTTARAVSWLLRSTVELADR